MRILLRISLLLLFGCGGRADLQCLQDSVCDLAGGGVCSSPGTGNQWCSYPDSSCASGLRYSDVEVGDGVAGMCVAGSALAGAPPDGPLITDGGAICKTRLAFMDGPPPFGIEGPGPAMRQIWVANLDGSGLVNLSNSPTSDNANPNWSPDGQHIAFQSNRTNNTYNIYTANADGSQLENITPNISASEPLWAPDGARISFYGGSPTGIWTMNIDGSDKTLLVQEPLGFTLEPSSWSPDSRSLLYAQINSSGNVYYQLYIVNIGTGAQPTKLNTGNSQEQDGSWASDSKVIFSNYDDIFSVNSDGSNIVNLTQNASGVEVFAGLPSPNGKTIPFNRKGASFNLAIWSIPIEGGTAVQVTQTGSTTSGTTTTITSDLSSSISPDGVTIGFERTTELIQNSTETVTSQVGAIKLDGSDLHLFNAPDNQHAHAAVLSTICH